MSVRDVNRIAKQIQIKGHIKSIDPDITSVVIIYYMSKYKEKIDVDIDNLLDICNKNKEYFVEAIQSDKIVRAHYAKNDERLAKHEFDTAVRELTDLQTAVGIYYYNLYDGLHFYKRLDAITLFKEAVLQNNQLANFYLGSYYCADSRDKGQGLYFHSRFLEHTINRMEERYRKAVADIINCTVYKHQEFVLLDYAIERAQKTVEDARSKFEKIQYEKDRLRQIAIENARAAVEMIKPLYEFKIDDFYNDDALKTYCY